MYSVPKGGQARLDGKALREISKTINYLLFFFCAEGRMGVRSASGRRCRKATAQNRRQPRPTGKPPDTGNLD